jgi:DNA-binding PadR family transcriptional regulator
MTPEDHLPLAPRDLLILAVLAEAPLHGYGIIKAVETRSEAGVLLDPANLYRVLHRMKRMGWLREVGPDSEGRRRTYTVTPLGTAILAAEVERLQRLLDHARPAVAGGEGR